EGAAAARDRAARDADEPAAAPEHGAVRGGRRGHPAGDAGVLPAARDARRPGRLHGGQDSVGARLRSRSLSGVDREGPLIAKPDLSRSPDRIAGMFDAIAPRYDLLNHLLSAGIDARWRARAIASLQLRGSERVLDACTGTADL